MSWTRREMAARAAAELQDGDYVNLGIGIPTLVPEFVDEDIEVVIHAENGILNVGLYPTEEQYDPDVINAAKETVTVRRGASYFDSLTSFTMIRGGRIDLSILGAFQVSAVGDLANWAVPGKLIKGIGGAMDLIAGAGRVLVLMEHVGPDGLPKIVDQCSLPLTGARVVDRIITDLCVIDITDEAPGLRELAPGVMEDDVHARTGTHLISALPLNASSGGRRGYYR
jgi:3-oxoacid CoA-transferase subunit B